MIKAAVFRASHYSREQNTAVKNWHDDLYVVSFPKSGATWMNFLMANIHLRASGLERRPTFFNITDIIPDIHYSRDIRAGYVLPFPGYRVFKSHDVYNPYYKKVIYIVRDPRDVMVSYFNFSVGLGAYAGDISSFVRSKDFGIETWCEHLDGWLKRSPASLRIHFIRYEDLIRDAFGTLQKMYALLGHHLDESLLSESIDASSFKSMKSLEMEYSHGKRVSSTNLKFMRKGHSGDWSGELSADDVEYINQKAKNWIQHFGY
jgi:hypothetical protein